VVGSFLPVLGRVTNDVVLTRDEIDGLMAEPRLGALRQAV
jgi:hypothetical protein